MTAVHKSEWKTYCNRVTKELEGKQAEIEVASLHLGGQLQAEWVPLIGITYDPKDDVFEVAVEGLDHLIHEPRELNVQEGPNGLASLEVVDAAGNRHLVQLREPLMLPPPRG